MIMEHSDGYGMMMLEMLHQNWYYHCIELSDCYSTNANLDDRLMIINFSKIPKKLLTR